MSTVKLKWKMKACCVYLKSTKDVKTNNQKKQNAGWRRLIHEFVLFFTDIIKLVYMYTLVIKLTVCV